MLVLLPPLIDTPAEGAMIETPRRQRDRLCRREHRRIERDRVGLAVGICLIDRIAQTAGTGIVGIQHGIGGQQQAIFQRHHGRCQRLR